MFPGQLNWWVGLFPSPIQCNVSDPRLPASEKGVFRSQSCFNSASPNRFGADQQPRQRLRYSRHKPIRIQDSYLVDSSNSFFGRNTRFYWVLGRFCSLVVPYSCSKDREPLPMSGSDSPSVVKPTNPVIHYPKKPGIVQKSLGEKYPAV